MFIRLGSLLLSVFSSVFLAGIDSCHSASQYEEDIEWSVHNIPNGVNWTYAIYKSTPSDPNSLLYFFHGANSDALAWLKTYKSLRDKLRQTGEPFPLVVAVSFGPKWLLLPKEVDKKNGLLDFFWKNIVPEVEAQLSSPIQKRGALGHSMGGYNALQLALNRPDFFDYLVLASPAVMNLSPYDNEQKILEYAKRTKAYSNRQKFKSFLRGNSVLVQNTNVILSTMRQFIPDNTKWQMTSLLDKAVEKMGAGFPKLYISSGDCDEFGLHEGARLLADIAQNKGVIVEYHLLQGGHSIRDDISISNFLRKK